MDKQMHWSENILLRIAAILGAVIAVIAHSKQIGNSLITLSPEACKIVLCTLNLLALSVFLLALGKIPKLRFLNGLEGKRHYCSLLEVIGNTSDKKIEIAERNNERVSRLVKQFHTNIVWYALPLLAAYALYIVEPTPDSSNKNLLRGVKIAQDLLNYLSAVFIYLAFKVLHDKTLDDNNHPINYYMDSILFSIFYIAVYLTLFIVDFPNAQNILSLVAGLVNGFAMTLLFARYISMELTVRNLQEITYPKGFIGFIILYIFPVYAIVQPLFGTFDIEAFTSKPETFKNIVFLFCFIGKVFFLYVTWLFINKKLMHLYMHLVITRHDIPQGFNTCFELKK